MNAPPGLQAVPGAPERRQVSGRWRICAMDSMPDWGLPALPTQIALDGTQLQALDPGSAYLLLRELKTRGARTQDITLEHFTPAQAVIFNLVRQHFDAGQAGVVRQRWWLAKLGEAASRFGCQLQAGLRLVGVLGMESLALVRKPQLFRLREFSNQIEAIFVTAIPLVLLMMFLLGVVFAYLLGRQALQYGANIFVVDGTTLAICRELSPVLVAILVAGRSGAAITAQLGTMKFDEEIDAIRVLGLSPYAVLIIPRVLALVLTLPLLVFLGDWAGILGSMLVAAQQLAIQPAAFVSRMMSAMDSSTVLVGLGKAPVFGLFIGLIASQGGLQVARNARSIGIRTTATVVQSIVAVILLNALIAVTLVQLGI